MTLVIWPDDTKIVSVLKRDHLLSVLEGTPPIHPSDGSIHLSFYPSIYLSRQSICLSIY